MDAEGFLFRRLLERQSKYYLSSESSGTLTSTHYRNESTNVKKEYFPYEVFRTNPDYGMRVILQIVSTIYKKYIQKNMNKYGWYFLIFFFEQIRLIKIITTWWQLNQTWVIKQIHIFFASIYSRVLQGLSVPM